jgi:hypothetical protein
VTTLTAPDTISIPKNAHTAVSGQDRRAAQRSAFSELREQAHQRTLMVIAVAVGIASVTVAASAAVLVGLAA